MSEDYYVVLAGGVGAAKFLDGLRRVVDPAKLKIIVNTGDDIHLFGLYICPDLDIITYTMADLVDKEKGWGFENESFNCLSILKQYYGFEWFNAGDKDLATHIFRTDLFHQGLTKAEITQKICQKLSIKAELIPMCNASVETFIRISEGYIHFEEFYIKHQCEPEILGVRFKNIDPAIPMTGPLEYIKPAKKVIICPSNPIVSIGTILQVKGIRKTLADIKEKVYAISPIIQGATVKGPADNLMEAEGYEATSLGVAQFYRDILGTFIIDQKDAPLKSQIEALGVQVHAFDTLMTTIQKKMALADFILNL